MAGLLEEDPRDALDGFAQVVSMEADPGEWWVPGAHVPQLRRKLSASWGVPWVELGPRADVAGWRGGGRGFKSLKQIVKLHYKLGNREQMMDSYRCSPSTPPLPPPQDFQSQGMAPASKGYA